MRNCLATAPASFLATRQALHTEDHSHHL